MGFVLLQGGLSGRIRGKVGGQKRRSKEDSVANPFLFCATNSVPFLILSVDPGEVVVACSRPTGRPPTAWAHVEPVIDEGRRCETRHAVAQRKDVINNNKK